MQRRAIYYLNPGGLGPGNPGRPRLGGRTPRPPGPRGGGGPNPNGGPMPRPLIVLCRLSWLTGGLLQPPVSCCWWVEEVGGGGTGWGDDRDWWGWCEGVNGGLTAG